MNDCQTDNQQQEMDYLRGASHALAAVANPSINALTALRWVNFLRGKAAAGRRIPPLMWFLGYVSAGLSPEQAYERFLHEQMEVVDE